MATNRKEKINKEFRKQVAQFIERESNRSSLVTLTRCEISKDLRRLEAYISVLPTEKEKDVLAFLSRRRSDLRDYLKKNLKIRTIPLVHFAIDEGEKNRQHIDQLLKAGNLQEE